LKAGKTSIRSSLDAWLYLLTRSENTEIELSPSVTANDPAIEAGIKRLASLSEDEKHALLNEQQKEITDLGIQQAEMEDNFDEGLKEGLKEGLARGHKEKQHIAKNIMKDLPDLDDAKISVLTGLSVDEIQAIRKG
jgi:flagellar biosynthesis/type III secretory pathway protein FliH